MPLSEEDGYRIHSDKIAEGLESLPRPRLYQRRLLLQIQHISATATARSTISATENVKDVDEDDVLITGGLTNAFRLPGWRIT